MIKNNTTQEPEVRNGATFHPPRSVYRSLSSEDDPVYWRSISCSPIQRPNQNAHIKSGGDSCSDDTTLLSTMGSSVNQGTEPVNSINGFTSNRETAPDHYWRQVADEDYYENSSLSKHGELDHMCSYTFKHDIMISSPGWHPFAVSNKPSSNSALEYLNYPSCHTNCPFQLHGFIQPRRNHLESDFSHQTASFPSTDSTHIQTEPSTGPVHCIQQQQQRASPHNYTHSSSPFHPNLPPRRTSPPLTAERRSPLFAFSTGTRANSAAPILCCFWDLESTGLSVRTDHITQIGCTCRVYHNPSNDENSVNASNGHFSIVRGLAEEAHDFSVYVKTDLPIPDEIRKLTSITNELLDEQGVELSQALEMWSNWLAVVQDCVYAAEKSKLELWLIAHNGNQFDLPLLFHQELSRLRWVPGTFLKQIKVSAIVDSVVLSRALFSAEREAALTAFNGARSHRLSDLYWDSFHEVIPNQHNALCDAKAVFLVMSREPFLSAWNQNLVAWKLSDYLQAFHKAFEKSREDPSGKRAAEMQINRYLADSVYSGISRSRVDFVSRQPVEYVLKPSAMVSLYPQPPQMGLEDFPSPGCATRPTSPLYSSVYFDQDDFLVLPASPVAACGQDSERLPDEQVEFAHCIGADNKMTDHDHRHHHPRGEGLGLPIGAELERHSEDAVPQMNSQACRFWKAFRQKAKAVTDRASTANRARVNQQISDAASRKKSNNQELCISGKA